jgi:hypothetical protein
MDAFRVGIELDVLVAVSTNVSPIANAHRPKFEFLTVSVTASTVIVEVLAFV